MKSQIYTLLLAGLAGCSTVPPEMKDGTTAAYTSSEPPRVVVDCMARNELKNGFALMPIVKEGADGLLEFSLRAGDGETHFYAEVKPAGMGSAMTVYTISIAVGKGIEAAMMSGC